MKKFLILSALFIMGFSVPAGALTITDNYYGYPKYDQIGQYYAIDGANISKNGTDLTVGIVGDYFTNYLSPLDSGHHASYAPGDLYINPTGWIVTGPAPYTKDIFTSSENWAFVVGNGQNGPGVYAVDFSTIQWDLDAHHPYQAWRGGYGEFVTAANITIVDGLMQFEIPDVTALHMSGDQVGFHWTMECGNDVFEGGTKVPEPATMLLFGVSLAGLGLFRRRQNS